MAPDVHSIQSIALEARCYNECEKEQIMSTENNKEHTDLMWFTNGVLATSTDKEIKVLLL